MAAEHSRLVAAAILLAAAAGLVTPAPSPPPVSWEALVAPYAVGREVTRGYVLSPPRRGAAHDVVWVARRPDGPEGPAGRIEIHVVPRGLWPGITETRSFGVAWEVLPAGANLAAPEEDARAVTDAVAAAVARNDSGFASVDAIPLAAEPPPPLIARVLDRFGGVRGMFAGAAAALACVILIELRCGPLALGAALAGLGLALRLPVLDLPFVHDQDAQRMFTGHVALREIATGVGLGDRHPPLYFFVLHVAQWFGQSEAAGRMPAVVTGAFVGPALLLAVRATGRRLEAAAVVAALAVTISPTLVAASREVSELPLFALLVLWAAAAIVAALASATPARLAAVAMFHGLALWTYYLAPLLIAAHGILALAWRARRVVAALAGGVALGAPALWLGAATLWRDYGARDVARAYPTLAWGQHTPLQMLEQIGRLAVDSFGWAWLALVAAATLVGVLRRQPTAIAALLGTAAILGGIALLSPIARVQAYYATAVLPLACLALAVVPDPVAAAQRRAWHLLLVLVLAISTVPRLGNARALYLPDADAFMPRFVAAIAGRPERAVVAIAHYDKTLLEYYLARLEGREIDWLLVDRSPTKRIISLVLVHALDAGTEDGAVARLRALRAEEPILVVERDAFLLPRVHAELSGCELVLEAPSARLLRCPATRALGEPADSAVPDRAHAEAG